MTNSFKPAHQKELFGHPVGLYVLFFTEMWERFSYYGMRALLTLYMTAQTLEKDPQGGLGWTTTEALALYGWYTMLVYLMSIPGRFYSRQIHRTEKGGYNWCNTLNSWSCCIGH